MNHAEMSLQFRPPPVIASAAKQSRLEMDCFATLAMTNDWCYSQCLSVQGHECVNSNETSRVGKAVETNVLDNNLCLLDNVVYA
jgi:hypothetical protein